MVVTCIDWFLAPSPPHLPPWIFLQLKKHFTDRLIIWNLDGLALPGTPRDFWSHNTFCASVSSPVLCLFGLKTLCDRVSCYMCRSHTNNRAFIASCFANYMAHEILFLQRLVICHLFWHRNSLALLKLQESRKKNKTNCILLSQSIRLQVRKPAENVGCFSHVIGNKPAVLGSLSLVRHKEAATRASAKNRYPQSLLLFSQE